MTKKKVAKSGITASAQRIWLAGLGAFATAEEEGSKLFHNLVNKGEKYQKSLKRPVGSAADKVRGSVREIRSRAGETLRKVEDVFDEQVGSALQRIGVPSRKEIAQLSRKVEQLTERLGGRGGGARRKTAKKRTTKKRSAKKKSAR